MPYDGEIKQREIWQAMNEIRLPELLLERYNTRFLGLISKLSRPLLGTYKPCSYSNNLASLPIKDNMLQRSLKLKIQNAINKAILADAEDRGVFVGGRRRNRKKKKNKNGKDRKKQKKNETKTSSIIICGSGSENDDDKPPVEDKKPLIEPEFCDYIDFDDHYIYDTLPELIEDRENLDPEKYPSEFIEDQENTDPEKMPFKLFGKKTDAYKKQEDVAAAVQSDKEPQTKEDEVIKKVDDKEEKQSPPDKTAVKPTEEGDSPDNDGTIKKVVEPQLPEGKQQDKNDVKINGIELNEVSAVTEQPKTTVTSPKEESPLINKKSGEGKDFGPGFLCCTIL